MGINLTSLHTSYELYADNNLISAAGRPGTDSSASIPYFKQDTAFFYAEKDVLVLTLHLSNFHLDDSGIWESIFFGDAETLRLNGQKRLAFEFFLLSCIFSMGLYHFGLFCMLIALRALTTGDYSTLLPLYYFHFN